MVNITATAKSIADKHPDIKANCTQLDSVILRRVPADISKAFQSDRAILFKGNIHSYDKGDINTPELDSVLEQRAELMGMKPGQRFLVALDTPGGSNRTGHVFTDKMEFQDNRGVDIITVAKNHASSMGSKILAGGSEGRRYAYEGVRVFVHGSRYMFENGDVKTQASYEEGSRQYKVLEKSNEMNRDHYEKHSSTNISRECVEALVRTDTENDDRLLTETDLLKLGLVDGIVETKWDYDKGAMVPSGTMIIRDPSQKFSKDVDITKHDPGIDTSLPGDVENSTHSLSGKFLSQNSANEEVFAQAPEVVNSYPAFQR